MPPKKKNVKSTQPARQSLRLRGVTSSPNQPIAPDLPLKTIILSKALPECTDLPPNLPVKNTNLSPPPEATPNLPVNLPTQSTEATNLPTDPPFPPPEIEMGNAVGTVSPNVDKNRNYDDCIEPTGSELPRNDDDDDDKNINDVGEDEDADEKSCKKLSGTRDLCDDDGKKLPARRALFSKGSTQEDEKYDNSDEYETDDSHSEFKPKGDGSDEFDSDQNLDDTYDLFDSEDFLNDLMADNHVDEVESKPKAHRNSRGNKDLGPQKPNLDGMTKSQADDAMREWKIARKAYTDNLNRMRKKGNHVLEGVVDYTGDQAPTIRKMTVVEERRLVAGHSFPTRTLLLLRVAEEANLRHIPMSIVRSDNRQLLVIGDKFLVRGSCSDKNGWVATKVFCRLDEPGEMPVISSPARAKAVGNVNTRDDDDDDNDDDDDDDITQKRRKTPKPRTPFHAEWLVPLIKFTIESKPNSSNDTLLTILREYGQDYALTVSIVQKARTLAREEIFGRPTVNAQYIWALQDELRLRGHFIEVLTISRKKALGKLMVNVVTEENRRRKKDGKAELTRKDDKINFLKEWTQTNKPFIDGLLGPEQNNYQFIFGILFAPSSTKRIVPCLQTMIQADAAHLRFGMFTLYSAYGSTANSNTSPIAFAILFGNEDKEGWDHFWRFALDLHPCLNRDIMTIMTDQQKGSKAAIEQVLPNANIFHCSKHRADNITKSTTGELIIISILSYMIMTNPPSLNYFSFFSQVALARTRHCGCSTS